LFVILSKKVLYLFGGAFFRSENLMNFPGKMNEKQNYADVCRIDLFLIFCRKCLTGCILGGGIQIRRQMKEQRKMEAIYNKSTEAGKKGKGDRKIQNR
jgi:glucose-6-phosphate-specific signal transduction histidine kinase